MAARTNKTEAAIKADTVLLRALILFTRILLGTRQIFIAWSHVKARGD